MRISDWSSDVCSSDLMQQTALLKLPRYEQPVGMHWASDTRLLVAKGRLIGSREKPLATGEIIATDFDGRNQLYVFGYQVRKTGMDRGFGVIEGMPPVRNGHFYMRHRAVNSRRSMLYDMDAQRGPHRLVADLRVEAMAFVLDPRGIPRFALGSTDYATSVLYQANDGGRPEGSRGGNEGGLRFQTRG